jgi:hypothetical protein
MDENNSPEQSPSPDHFRQPLSVDRDMATVVVSTNPAILSPSSIGKRYRPAPAKTFQCRGYGECRMVFSRSEHLARHIRSVPSPRSTLLVPSYFVCRKHTGERPFSCHCGKQFSRLDNLRQHAQTVHADKQEQNERMMRDLTSLHASMAAANKAGQSRGKRSQMSSSSTISASSTNGIHPAPNTSAVSTTTNKVNHVKEEDDAPSSLPVHQRPDTSTGYECNHDSVMYQPPTAWHMQTPDLERPANRHPNSHSFRDPGQSFLASHNSTPTSSQSHSFLSFPAPFDFSVPDSTRDGRPGSSTSRPPTSESHPRSLPPLASVIPTSIPPPAANSHHSAQPHLHPFPSFRRPSTATRPGTAPASYYAAKPSYIGGPGLAPRPELSFLIYGRDMAASQFSSHHGGFDTDITTSPATGTSYDSPFSFHPPALADTYPNPNPANSITACGPSSPPNPRKRAFTGADGPEFDYDYDYGSESRPQSRRLSVMELCNDQPAADREFLLLSGSGASRPGTSSGLGSSTSTFAFFDRPSAISVPAVPDGTGTSLFSRIAQAAAGAAMSATGEGETQFDGRGLSSAFRRGVWSATEPVLQPINGSPTISDSSVGYSPRSASCSSYSPRSPQSLATSARGLQSQPNSPPPPTDMLSRRGSETQHNQVRVPVSAPNTPAAVGMRV